MGIKVFSRIKNWLSLDNFTAKDINDEFNNLYTNLGAPSLSGASGDPATVQGMRETADPGAVGSENLPVTIQDDVQQLRHQLQEIQGTAQWYSPVPINLENILGRIDTSVPPDGTIVSGRVNADGQPNWVLPQASAAGVNFFGATTPLKTFFNGEEYFFDENLSITGLQLAPSTDNSTFVSTIVSGYGFPSRNIFLTSEPTNFGQYSGKYAAFSVDNGADVEYFVGRYEGGTAPAITGIRRAFFFNDTGSHVRQVNFAPLDIVTILNLTYIFAITDGTTEEIAITYNQPFSGSNTPVSPANGDFWYDTSVLRWKRFGGVTWSNIDAVFLGWCAQDDTDTVGARASDPRNNYNSINTLVPFRVANDQLRVNEPGGTISVYGSLIEFGPACPAWVMPQNLESGLTEQSNTVYMAYVTPQGGVVLSDQFPVDRRSDLRGFYHPGKPWRLASIVLNDGFSNFSPLTGALYDFSTALNRNVITSVPFTGTTEATIPGSEVEIVSNGMSPVVYELFPSGSTSVITLTTTGASGTVASVLVKMYRNGLNLQNARVSFRSSGTGPTTHQILPGAIRFVDFPPAGRHYYSLRFQGNAATDEGTVVACVAMVRALDQQTIMR